MIKKIKVINFKAMSDVNIDFTKSQINYHPQMVMEDLQIVNPSVFYGENASGKTCFVEVFKALKNFINNTDAVVPNYYIAPDQEIVIEVQYVIKNIDYLYKIVLKNGLIKSANLVVDEIEQIDKTDIVKSHEFFKALIIPDLNASQVKHDEHLSYITNLKKYNSQVTKLINFLTNSEYSELDFSNYSKNTSDISYCDGNEEIVLNYYRDMSVGVKKLYRLITTLYATNKNGGGVVIIDDLDMNIHSITLIKLIQSLNKKFPRTQLICTMHNTAPMRHLRPDQIYFATKFAHISQIDRLNVVCPKIREVHNIEKLYYGGKITSRINEKYLKN